VSAEPRVDAVVQAAIRLTTDEMDLFLR
jgi:hypothetical protein